MKIGELIRTLRFVGWETPYRAIVYALMRDRADRKIKRQKIPEISDWQPVGTLRTVEPTAHGAKFDFELSELEIDFLEENVARVSWRPGEPPVPYAIQEHFWPGAEPSLAEKDQSWTLRAGDNVVSVSDRGALTWLRQNQPIRNELPPLHYLGAWRHITELAEESAVYGLAGRTRGLNLRGGNYQLWNRDPGGSYGQDDDPLYLNVPTMLITEEHSCHLVFFENSYDAKVEIDSQLSLEFDEGMLRYYLFFGNLEQIYDKYTDLTGKPPMPPRWALGFHQSRWGYRNEDDVLEVLAGFEEHDLPISSIHLDIDYMHGYRVFTVDEGRFPDLSRLSEKAEKRGVRLVAILDPGVKIDNGFRLYRDGLKEDIFCTLSNDRPLRVPVWPGWVRFPDFTSPDTRRWWSKKYPFLLRQGIAGFWHDMNEPSAFAAWGDPTLPLSTRHTLEGKVGQHRQAHNLYGLLMNRAGLEALREFRPEKRPFILSRSGWAGNQRFAWNWTGDVESTWEGLRVSLNLMLGMSMSGILFTGSDIGGFSGDPGPELMLRWMQLAAFTPFFRIHSAHTTPRREIWLFEDPHRAAMREALILRSRLMPYLYTLARQASLEGQPLMRPFFWENPSNPSNWNIEDQFFLGPDLLIAPVLESGTNAREVILPEGKWHSLWHDTTFTGPVSVEVQTPLEHLPVFVRAGTILPLADEQLQLHVYPGSKHPSEHLLYSDAGDGYGPQRIDRFRLIPSKDAIDIEHHAEGSFPFPYQRMSIFLHSSEPRAVKIDGKEQTAGSSPLLIDRFEHIRFDY